MNTRKLAWGLLPVAAVAMGCLASPALADDDDRGRGRDRKEQRHDDRGRNDRHDDHRRDNRGRGHDNDDFKGSVRLEIGDRHERSGSWTTVEERVLVRAGYHEERVIPAVREVRYGPCGERYVVIVRPERCERVWIPPVYELRCVRKWVPCDPPQRHRAAFAIRFDF